MVDEHTELKISDFFDTKNSMVEPTCAKLYKWIQNGIKVKKIRLDNAGENKLLQQRADSKDWKLAIDFEFTSAMMPQQNHLAEIAFATLSNRGHAMMYCVNIPDKVKPKVCRDAFQTATKLDGLILITLDGETKTRYENLGVVQSQPLLCICALGVKLVLSR
jgi:hypothetical protein